MYRTLKLLADSGLAKAVALFKTAQGSTDAPPAHAVSAAVVTPFRPGKAAMPIKAPVASRARVGSASPSSRAPVEADSEWQEF